MKVYSWSLDERPLPTTIPDKLRRFVERRLPAVVMFLMVATLVVVALAPYVVVTVPSGQVGVLWKRFAHGTVRDPRQLRGEGLHLLLPWDKLFIYDLRVQSLTDTYNAISKDGVNLNATLNIRFRLQRNSVPILHQAIGPDYTKLLGPQIASQMRGVIAEYTAEQVYSSARQEIQDKIRETAVEKLSHKMMDAEAPGEDEAPNESPNIASMQDTVVLYDTLLYGIELPPSVVGAINRKTEQYYIAQEYAFRIDRERKESERKAIEAAGISEFQRIVSQGISDSYLRWRGVEATLQLAQSNNSKVVIIGGGKDGLPIILGNVDSPAPARARGTSPAENGAAAEERSTSAPPAVPLEKMPAADLALPAEKMPPADSAKTLSAAPSTPSAAPPGETGALFPRSLSELEGLVSRALRPSEATTERPAKLPSERPAVELTR
jgi:regulator of protease activity HflC (stomatin/prohibitin superfamily)